MGARPLRRAIQRYIEDPLADEVLAQNLHPGSTVEVEKAPDGDEREVTITIAKPARKREKVGVGAEGGETPALEDGGHDGEHPEGELSEDLEVPDAPPAPEGDGDSKDD